MNRLIAVLVVLLVSTLAWAAAPTRATLPTPSPDFDGDNTADTNCAMPTAVDYTVCASGCDYSSIQAAIDAVEAGTIGPPLNQDGLLITVATALTTTSEVRLADHDGDGTGDGIDGCDDFVYIVPENYDTTLPARGTRVQASDKANMVHIQRDDIVGTSELTLRVDADAKFWWLRGWDISMDSDQAAYNDGGALNLSQFFVTSPTALPEYIILEQVYFQSHDEVSKGQCRLTPATSCSVNADCTGGGDTCDFFYSRGRRGLLWAGSNVAIVDSYIGDFYRSGDESQGMGALDCLSGGLFQNNKVVGGSINFLIGGGTTTGDCTPGTDLTIRNNHFFRPKSWLYNIDSDGFSDGPLSFRSDGIDNDRDGTTDEIDEHDDDVDNDGTINTSDDDWMTHQTYWDGKRRGVKNNLEFKHALRVLVEGNVFENNSADAQTGRNVLITPQCGSSCPDAADTTFGTRHITIRGNYGHYSTMGWIMTGGSSAMLAADLDSDGTGGTFSKDCDLDGTIDITAYDDGWQTNGSQPTRNMTSHLTIEHNVQHDMFSVTGNAIILGGSVNDILFSHNTWQGRSEFDRTFELSSNDSSPNYVPFDFDGDCTPDETQSPNFITHNAEIENASIENNLFYTYYPGTNDPASTSTGTAGSPGQLPDVAGMFCEDGGWFNDSEECWVDTPATVIQSNVFVGSGGITPVTGNYPPDVDGSINEPDVNADLRMADTGVARAGFIDTLLEHRLCTAAGQPVSGCAGKSVHAAGALYDASDGTDMGADITALDCLIDGVTDAAAAPTGTWESCFITGTPATPLTRASLPQDWPDMDADGTTGDDPEFRQAAANCDGGADCCVQPTDILGMVCEAPYAVPSTNTGAPIGGDNPLTNPTQAMDNNTSDFASYTTPTSSSIVFASVSHDFDFADVGNNFTGFLNVEVSYTVGDHNAPTFNLLLDLDGDNAFDDGSQSVTTGAVKTTYTFDLKGNDANQNLGDLGLRVQYVTSCTPGPCNNAAEVRVYRIWLTCDYTTVQSLVDARAAGTASGPGLYLVDNAITALDGNPHALTLKKPSVAGDGDANLNECVDYTWLVTDEFDQLPADGTRVSPLNDAAMVQVRVSDVAGTSERAIFIEDDAQHWVLRGWDISSVGSSGEGNSALVQYESVAGAVPSHIAFWQSLIRGGPPAEIGATGNFRTSRRAFLVAGDYLTWQDNHIGNIYDAGSDSQGIVSSDCADQVTITNNFIEAAAENIMLGGGTPSANCKQTDWIIRHNWFFKPPWWLKDRDGDGITDDGTDTDVDNDGTVNASDTDFTAPPGDFDWDGTDNGSDVDFDADWDGTQRNVKNLFELKNGSRILFEGNVLQNNAVDGQAGYSILYTPKCQCGDGGPSDQGGCAYSSFGVSDVTTRGNVFFDIPAFLSISGQNEAATLCDLDGDGTTTYDHDGDGTGTPFVNDDSWESIPTPQGGITPDSLPAGQKYVFSHNAAYRVLDTGSKLWFNWNRIDDIVVEYNTLPCNNDSNQCLEWAADPDGPGCEAADKTDVDADGTLDYSCEPVDRALIANNIFYLHYPLGTATASYARTASGGWNEDGWAESFTTPEGDGWFYNVQLDPTPEGLNGANNWWFNNDVNPRDGTPESFVADSNIANDPNSEIRFASDPDGDSTVDYTGSGEIAKLLDLRLCTAVDTPLSGCTASPHVAGGSEDSTDGEDLGADIIALNCMIAGVVAGTPTGAWNTCGFPGVTAPPTPVSGSPLTIDGITFEGGFTFE